MIHMTDLYPLKSQFLRGEEIQIVAELEKPIDNIDGLGLVCEVRHLRKLIFEQTFRVCEADLGLSTLHIPFTLPEKLDQGRGYDVKILFIKKVKIEGQEDVEVKELETGYTAVQVFDKPCQLPRYGFLSDYDAEEKGDLEDVMWMRKLHINMVQFYDWMYRHHNLVAFELQYEDLMGKKNDASIIQEKIQACHQLGMKAVAYGAIYACDKSFYEEHPEWALYNQQEEPLTFIDIFYYMNIEESCGWHEHIVDQYKRALYFMNFDGIHMDTYGEPKKAKTYKGETLYLKEHFNKLIDHTKEALRREKEENMVVFNNVGNWPVAETAKSNQDCMYIEVWEPYVTYNHIKSIIDEAYRASGNSKEVILAAYLAPFRTGSVKGASHSLLYLTAVIGACGGFHLIAGENKKVLTQGYYADYSPMEDWLEKSYRNYQDHLVRHSDIFYDHSLEDVSQTHSEGDNIEYKILHDQTAVWAKENKIWVMIRENKHRKVIHFINLMNNDIRWNEEKIESSPIEHIDLKVLVESTPRDIYWIAPEEKVSQDVRYEIQKEKVGDYVKVRTGKLRIWGTLIVDLIN